MALWKKNRRVYGARKLHKAARRGGIDVGRDQVATVMRKAGISGVKRGKKRRTTWTDETAERPADLVDRKFSAPTPNRLWVADITYVPTWSGFAYVAFVTDAYSRAIVGWKVSSSLSADLALDALEMAIWKRKGDLSKLVHHSDRGVQGGFKRPSQHLETEVLVWVFESGSVRFSCIGARSPRRVARRWRGARIVSDSGPRLPKDFPLRMLPPRPRCRRPSASDSSATLVAWDRTFLQPCQVVTCRSLSARTSLCGVRKMSVSVRSLAD